MSRIVVWVGPALLATALVAQQQPADASAPRGAPPAAERYAALQADQKKMMDEYMAMAREASAKAKEAKAEGKPVPAMPLRPDATPLVERAQAAAKDYAGTDDAVQFLVFIVRNAGGKGEAVTTAFETLAEKHLDHEALGQIAPQFPYLSRNVGEEKAPQLLDRFAKSANPDVRGWVAYVRHQKTIEEAERTGSAYRTAKAELQKAAEVAKDERLKNEISSAIEIREKFSVGLIAPDIEGQDLDGVSFKLSDYKGKVVFLDFWGDW